VETAACAPSERPHPDARASSSAGKGAPEPYPAAASRSTRRDHSGKGARGGGAGEAELEPCGREEDVAAEDEVERVRGGEGEESRSRRREAAAGGERKSAAAAAVVVGRRRSGEEVRRREESSLEAPPMVAEQRKEGFAPLRSRLWDGVQCGRRAAGFSRAARCGGRRTEIGEIKLSRCDRTASILFVWSPVREWMVRAGPWACGLQF